MEALFYQLCSFLVVASVVHRIIPGCEWTFLTQTVTRENRQYKVVWFHISYLFFSGEKYVHAWADVDTNSYYWSLGIFCDGILSTVIHASKSETLEVPGRTRACRERGLTVSGAQNQLLDRHMASYPSCVDHWYRTIWTIYHGNPRVIYHGKPTGLDISGLD